MRNGIQVPEEVAILGGDNIEFLCNHLNVPLSSIDTRLEALGYTAATQLHRLMSGEIGNTEPPIFIEPGAVVSRRSTDVMAVIHPMVAKALEIMRGNFGKTLNVEQVCDQVGMSKRGLEKAFRAELKCSPAEELRRIRIAHAKQLLTQTDRKVESVARECGYCNSSNLSLAFRRTTGISPNEYRKKFANQKDSEKENLSFP